MSCWALVPLKGLGRGKTRLSPDLPPEARQLLVLAMLDRVLSALRRSHLVDRIALVGPSADQCPSGVLHLMDPGRGLNEALLSSSAELWARGASELLVIHADLPGVEGAEIDNLIRSGQRHGVALASDRHGRGTNALHLGLPLEFPFRFGINSLHHHRAAAQALGIQPAVVGCASLGLDIDTIADLQLLNTWPRAHQPRQSHSQWNLCYA